MSKNLLEQTLEHIISDYLHNLDGETPTALHALVMQRVEACLITELLKHTQGNQSQCARLLGITRNTLRKKIDHYQIDPPQ